MSFAGDGLTLVLPELHGFWRTTLVLPFILLLSLLEDLNKLTPHAIAGSVFLLASIIMVIVESVLEGNAFEATHRYTPYQTLADWSNLPIFVGVICYSVESVGVVMPFRNAMANPAEFPAVAFTVIGLAFVFYCTLGLAPLHSFGSSFNSSNIIVFLGQFSKSSSLFSAMNVLLVCSTVLSYPLQLAPTVDTLSKRLGLDEDNHRSAAALRVSLVLVTYGLALFIDDLGLLVSLFGSLACFISMALPCLCDLRLRTVQGKWPRIRQLAMDLTCATSGTVFLVLAIIWSLHSNSNQEAHADAMDKISGVGGAS
jgi:hypothetical protein